MKASLFILFFIVSVSLPAQRYDPVGTYAGGIVKDEVSIRVTLDIKKDSTYKFSMNYNFKEFCTGKDTGSMSFSGSWKADEDWIFLDPLDLGIDIFFQYEKWSKHDKEVMARNVKKDRLPLKVVIEKNKCPQISFRINSDCFKEVWIYNPIQKLNCKQK